jgi:periplasmic protein TonB
MPRMFKLVSVGIHSVVLAFVFFAQAWTVGPLPNLRQDSIFVDHVPAAVVDIPLPPPTRSAAPASDHSTPSNAAPIEAPVGVADESRLEPTTSGTSANSLLNAGGAIDPGTIPGTVLPPAPPPAPAAQKPIPLHQGIQPPRKIVDVQPLYPPLARAAHQQGVVILETIIDAAGSVEQVRVLRGFPLLDQAAIDAVRQWRFTPALLNGQPVPVVMTVTVNFVLQP